jgi:hypothetical protein
MQDFENIIGFLVDKIVQTEDENKLLKKQLRGY